MILYHFTCRHAAERIEVDGDLKPHTQVQLDGRELVWLTDLESPRREQLGLTSFTLRCDRMEYRATVDCEAQPWPEYLRGASGDVRLAARSLIAGVADVLPMHWYVTAEPVKVLALERVS
jgi:hypothetical protein